MVQLFRTGFEMLEVEDEVTHGTAAEVPSNNITNTKDNLGLLTSRSKYWVDERMKRMISASVLLVSLLALAVGLAFKLVHIQQENHAFSAAQNSTVAGDGNTLSRSPTTTLHPKPTIHPTSIQPTTRPAKHSSNQTTIQPADGPSRSPSQRPTRMPTVPTPNPTPKDLQVTTFYAIGDVPYDARQAYELIGQMDSIPADADFVIHVGDIRSARNRAVDCRLAEYQDVALTLKRSPVPVFIVLGDNEWNDCSNPQQGLRYWYQTFQGMESKYWKHGFQIERYPGRNETFAFVHKETLFIGLDLVGGRRQSDYEWETRLREQAEWTIELIKRHTVPTVIFGHGELHATQIATTDHFKISCSYNSNCRKNLFWYSYYLNTANPRTSHKDFFDPLTSFIRDEWYNRLPILYLNGDRHEWEFNSTFYDQSNWQRIMLTGGTTDPPLKVQIHSAPSIRAASEAFMYDRQL